MSKRNYLLLEIAEKAAAFVDSYGDEEGYIQQTVLDGLIEAVTRWRAEGGKV